jgi:hypothetical protein
MLVSRINGEGGGCGARPPSPFLTRRFYLIRRRREQIYIPLCS